MEPPKEIVLLVHGIRTFAWWQPMVKKVLQEIPNVEVWECEYGYFDVFRFWCPLFTRRASMDEVRGELEKAMKQISEKFPGGRLSVIAHSYGTYVVTRLLAEKLDLRLHRLVLCGSIVRRRYPWHTVGDRIADHPTSAGKKMILNDFGLRDIWPVLAKCLSWGYGDTGRHKFGKAEVFDRAHDFAHSGFFTTQATNPPFEPGEEFVRTYWKPWFEKAEVTPSPVDGHSPLWLSWLSIMPLQWILALVLVISLLFLIAPVWQEMQWPLEGAKIIVEQPYSLDSEIPVGREVIFRLVGVDEETVVVTWGNPQCGEFKNFGRHYAVYVGREIGQEQLDGITIRRGWWRRVLSPLRLSLTAPPVNFNVN